jgi:transcriptional regulator with XRE-family HTH domain
MADNSWRNLDVWERVKWARSQHFDSASAAAEALGMKEGTYRCYERGPGSAKFIPLEFKHAKLFSREFKVRWEWLLEGVGEPWLTKPRDEEPVGEGKGPLHHLRAWREYRGLSAAELARKGGTSAQMVTDLETGAIELSENRLRALADALSTTAGRVLDVDPNSVDPLLLDAVEAIPKDRRGQALEILRTFRVYNRLR